MNNGMNNNSGNGLNNSGVGFPSGTNTNPMNQSSGVQQANNGGMGLGSMVQQQVPDGGTSLGGNQNFSQPQAVPINGVQQPQQAPANVGMTNLNPQVPSGMVPNPNPQAPSGMIPNQQPMMGQPSMQQRMPSQMPQQSYGQTPQNSNNNNFVGEKPPILLIIITILVVVGVIAFLVIYLKNRL